MIRLLITRLVTFALMVFAISPSMGMGISLAQAAPAVAVMHHHGQDKAPIHCAGHDCPAAPHCCDMGHCMIYLAPTAASIATTSPQSAPAATIVVSVHTDAGYPPERPPRTL